MLLIEPYAVSNKIFPTYCRPTVFLKMCYRDIVAFRKKIEWLNRSWPLTCCKLQTSHFPL